MSNDIMNRFVGNINLNHSRFLDYARDLTEDELLRQPSRTAPPIGWHIWHIMRWADMLQASFPDHTEVWKTRNLSAEYGLDSTTLGPLQMGTSISHEMACHIATTIDRERLMAYTQTVNTLCQQALAGLQDDDLLRPRTSIVRLDFSTNPPGETAGDTVPLIHDLDFHLGQANRHLGMIEALIGVMFDREGTADI
jgi:hypothetical protein